MARQMKESGIEWIGEIPADWNIGKVGYFYDIQLGKMLQPTKEFEDDTLEPYLCAANVGGNRFKLYPTKEMWFNPKEKSKYCVSNGDLLVVEGGDIASCDIVSECNSNIYIQNALHRVRTKKGNDNRFLKYWLWFVKSVGYIDLICNKATIAHFSKEKFISLPYIITAKNERVIADYLDKKCSEVDAVMLKTKATIEEYKKLKQSVITESVVKGIRNNRPMRDSKNVWYGHIPTDWRICKLKYVFQIKKDIAGKEGYTVLSITQRGIRPKDVASNEGQLADDYSNYQIVNPGDFAMNHMDLLTGWVDISQYSGVTSPDYRVFTLIDSQKHYAKYYLYLMQMCYSNRIFYGLGQGVSGMGRWRLQADKFLNFTIPVPSFEEQKEISDYLDKKCAEIDTLIAKKKALLEELEAYKKSLIFEYVTGKKEVQ